MGIQTMRRTTTHLVRCDLCGNATHNIYYVTIGGMQYKFCSGAHANAAHNNYQLKIDKGITPTIKHEEVEDLDG